MFIEVYIIIDENEKNLKIMKEVVVVMNRVVIISLHD